jgi:hypothetical protein
MHRDGRSLFALTEQVAQYILEKAASSSTMADPEKGKQKAVMKATSKQEKAACDLFAGVA